MLMGGPDHSSVAQDLGRSSTSSFWSSTYDRTVRTESYNQIMTKMDLLSTCCSTSGDLENMSNLFCTDQLLQPSHSTVDNVLRHTAGSEPADIIRIATEYFHSNHRTSHLCGALFHSIHETRIQCGDVDKRALSKMPQANCGDDERTLFTHVPSGDIDQTPRVLLEHIQTAINDVWERYDMISREVEKRRRLVGREMRVLKRWKRGCMVGIVIGVHVAGAVIIAVVTYAVASVAGAVQYHKENRRSELDGKEKAKVVGRYKRELSILRMQEEKLEALAKGCFTVRRMLETLRCLVAGLEEDVRRLVEFGWWAQYYREDNEVYMQQAAALHLHLAQQLDHLEEHLVVCFLIINKTSDWVLQEFSPILEP